VKKRDLERRLKAVGWYLLRNGGSHDIWTNGTMQQPVPRHNEIPERLAKSIVKHAEDNPGPTKR
jgi:mRNA interferase HicA